MPGRRWRAARRAQRQARADARLWAVLDQAWPAHGRVGRVQAALHRGANVNAPRPAMLNGGPPTLSSLDTAPADAVDAPRALLLALAAYDLPLVRALLGAGADPRQGVLLDPTDPDALPTSDGPRALPGTSPTTPVLDALAMAGPWPALHLGLLRANAVLTASHSRAARADALDLVERLLEAGADPGQRAQGHTAIDLLLHEELRDGGVVRHWPVPLLRRMGLGTAGDGRDAPGTNGNGGHPGTGETGGTGERPAGTPLHRLTARFSEHTARKLIEAGGRLDARDAQGLTPLDRWVDHLPADWTAQVLARLRALLGEPVHVGIRAMDDGRRARLLAAFEQDLVLDPGLAAPLVHRLREAQVAHDRAVLQAVLTPGPPGSPGGDAGSALESATTRDGAGGRRRL